MKRAVVILVAILLVGGAGLTVWLSTRGRTAPTSTQSTGPTPDEIGAWAAEAQAAWPEFAAAFRDPDASSQYMVITHVQDPGGRWWFLGLSVIEITDDRVRAVTRGTGLDSGFKSGDVFEFGTNEVLDWAICTPAGELVVTWDCRGRFSGDALVPIRKPAP